MLDQYLLIGQVLRPQGVKGLVKVRPDTDDPERFLDLEEAYILRDGAYKAVTVCDVSIRDEDVYLRLDGADTRDKAEAQRDTMLYVDREHAVALEADENFICDIVGCRAVDTKGAEIGTVKEILQPGANDVYVIATKKGDLLVPALKRVIPTVDVTRRLVVLDENELPSMAVYPEG